MSSSFALAAAVGRFVKEEEEKAFDDILLLSTSRAEEKEMSTIQGERKGGPLSK